MAPAQNSKAPPVLKEGSVYAVWLHELSAWELITDIAKSKQAVHVYLYGLEGQYKDLISKIPIADLNTEGGLKVITDKLGGFCKQSESQRAYSTYEKLHNFRRKSGQSVSDALLNFDTIVSEFTGMKMKLPEEVMAFHVVKAMNLSDNVERLAKATVSELTYQAMVEKIKSLVVDDTVTAAAERDLANLTIKSEPDDVYYTNTRGGRGRGSYGVRGSYRQRGRGRGEFQKHYGNASSEETQRRCYNCNSYGHLSYDCPQKKEGTVTHNKTCFKCHGVGHFANVCPNKSNTVNITLLQSNVGVNEFSGETLGHAVIDSACKHSLAGSVWMEEYLKTLSQEERKEVKEESCSMSFRFGDGVEVVSNVKVTIPVVFGGTKCKLETAIINNELPLLLSIYSMRKGKVKLNFENETVELLGNTIKMKTTSSGHVMIPLTDKEVCGNSNIVLHVTNLKSLSRQEKLIKMKKLHVQFSHASKESLWRLLVSSGIEDKSLQEALAVVTAKCDICKQYKRKPLRPCVSEPLAETFNSTVAMDLKTVEKDKVYLLHLIDLGTRYSAAGVVKSKHQDVIIKKVLSLWIQTFGAPRRFLTDNGGEFSNDSFRELCQQLNVVSTTTPGESPWSNGVVERHNAILMETINLTMSESKCDLETAVSWSVSSKNTLSNRSGYSPNVLVFGKNPNFPSVLSDAIPALEPCTVSEIVRLNCNARQCAMKGYIAADCSERIRRALRMKIRVSNNLIVANGDSVYYRREKYKG